MPRELIVCKFGGTSVANARQIIRTGEIIKSDPRRKIIVVSAPGKRSQEDQKVTDLLQIRYQKWCDGENPIPEYEMAKQRFLDLCHELNLDKTAIAFVMNHLHGIISPSVATAGPTEDYFVSRGEYLNAFIVANYLGYEFCDAQDIIFFDSQDDSRNPKVDWALTDEMVGRILLPNIKHGVVVPGFYGTLPGYGVKTFTRGGSDITGAVLAKSLKADLYENWTDVQGLHTADPRIIAGAQHVREVTYREMRELAYSGAIVLHPDAIPPVMEAGIPINIKNTNAPTDPGTMVVAQKKEQCGHITGIASRSGFMAFNITKMGMNDQKGFIRSITEIFEQQGINIEHTPDGIDRFSVIVRVEDVLGKGESLLREIEKVCEFNRESAHDYLETSYGLVLVTVVSENVEHTPGLAGRIFSACGNAGINIRMITQSTDGVSIVFGVNEADERKTIMVLYNEFFNKISLKHKWLVAIRKDGGEDAIIPFDYLAEAEKYQVEAVAQGYDAYLCEVKKEPS